jgi:AraC-like DNA-binding protein
LIDVDEAGTMTKLTAAGKSTGKERLEAFQHTVSDMFPPLAGTTDDVAGFSGRLQSASLGTVQLFDLAATSSVVRRTQNLIRRNAPDYLKVSLQVRGRCVMSQDGREAALGPGDFALQDTTRPYQLVFNDAFRMIVVMFPRKLLRLPPARLAHLTAHRVPGRQGLGALVSPFLVELGSRLDKGNLTSDIHLSDAILDLFAASFAEQPACENLAAPEARRRGLLLRIHVFIEDRLDDPWLDPATVAAAHHISVRYLQKLFKDDGDTVTGWIRARRLEHCRRDLAEAQFAELPVSSVAARWGLVDAAHFSRLFKATYGLPPTEYRRQSAELSGLCVQRRLECGHGLTSADLNEARLAAEHNKPNGICEMALAAGPRPSDPVNRLLLSPVWLVSRAPRRRLLSGIPWPARAAELYPHQEIRAAFARRGSARSRFS